MPRIRSRPQDFFVEEIPLEELSGRGEHLCLWIEKRGVDTLEVVQRLAALAGARARDVGFAGRKDRHAVTRQWFSVVGLPASRAQELSCEEIEVLGVGRHSTKLRLGDLLGNRFRIVVREAGDVDPVALDRAAAGLAERGAPNRFGSQRFGRDGANLVGARRMLDGERPTGDRRQQRFLAAALQAAVFNRVLELRRDDWHVLLPGDLALVERSGRIVEVADPGPFADRLARFEVSPSGPMVGPKMRWPKAEALESERRALEDLGLAAEDLSRLVGRLGMNGGRRALRVACRRLVVSREEDCIRVEFELTAGAFATTVLEELLGEVPEEGPA